MNQADANMRNYFGTITFLFVVSFYHQRREKAKKMFWYLVEPLNRHPNPL